MDKTNFKEGDVWISSNRAKYKILSVDNSPGRWYPLLLEHVDTEILYTANEEGEIYHNMVWMEDKLVMKINTSSTLDKKNKEVADRMLNVYNTRMSNERKHRDEQNKKILRWLKRDKDKNK